MSKRTRNLETEKMRKLRTQRILSVVFLAIDCVGALGVGVSLILSEILYPQIEELFDCPAWYQAFLYVSFAVSVGAIVGCGFTKNRKNTPKLECYIELALFWTGLACELVCALARTESHVLNVFICIGGAISSVGFFCGIGSFIGRMKKPKKGEYEKIYYGKIPYQNLPALPDAATPKQIIEAEEFFGTMFPNELIDFLLEFNGDGNMLFSAAEIAKTTQSMRGKFKEPDLSGASKFCFFGSDGAENYICYRIRGDGSIAAGEIYLWDNGSNETRLIANALPELIEKYYGNEKPHFQ